jgi:hypothetical protein
MSSATFDQLLVLLGSNLTFKDTNMGVCAARRRISSNIKGQENIVLFLIKSSVNYSFI